MKKLLVVLVVLACCLFWTGCLEKTKAPVGTSGSESGESATVSTRVYQEIVVELTIPEGGRVTQVTSVDGQGKKTVRTGKVYGEKLSIYTGDYDDILRRVRMVDTEKSDYKILIKGEKDKDIKLAADIQLDGAEPKQKNPSVHLDKNGDGWIKVYLDPFDPKKKGYRFDVSKKGAK